MIDIAKEVEKLIWEEGYPILLIRANKKIKCSCGMEMAGSSKCPICFGTGFITKVEKHLTYSTVASVPETLPRLIRRTESSVLAIEARNFYFPRIVAPDKKDLIAVCEFRGLIPLLPIVFYEVSHSEAYRARKGKIQYYRASTSLDPVNSSIKGFNLRRSDQGVIDYIPKY